jgi:hypothetical protein
LGRCENISILEHAAPRLQIDAKVRELAGAGLDDLTIMGEMHGQMPDFKRLLDTSARSEMEQLGARFPGFYRYAKILEAVAAGIKAGRIRVPK